MYLHFHVIRGHVHTCISVQYPSPHVPSTWLWETWEHENAFSGREKVREFCADWKNLGMLLKIMEKSRVFNQLFIPQIFRVNCIC